jgi:hypothetical protein
MQDIVSYVDYVEFSNKFFNALSLGLHKCSDIRCLVQSLHDPVLGILNIRIIVSNHIELKWTTKLKAKK